jgi:hypothetical protein
MIVLPDQIDKQIDRILVSTKAVQGGSNRRWTLRYRNMLFGAIDPPKWRLAVERSVRNGLPHHAETSYDRARSGKRGRNRFWSIP